MNSEKTSLVDGIIETLDKDLRVFNLNRFYGAEINPQALVDTARTLPMGTDRTDCSRVASGKTD